MTEIYEEIKAFMKAYCRDYDTLAQEADTVDVLDKYCTPDFVSTAFMSMKGQSYPFCLEGLEAWKRFLVEGHKTVVEDFIPEDLFVDPIKMTAVARLCIKKFDKHSGQQLLAADAVGCYQLTRMDGQLRMSSLQFFTGDTSQFAGLYNRKKEEL